MTVDVFLAQLDKLSRDITALELWLAVLLVCSSVTARDIEEGR